MNKHIKKYFLVLFCAFFLSQIHIQNAFAEAWRIKVFDSALVTHDIVTLGDIAEPLGSLSQAEWNKLKDIQLFAAPTEEGKPFQISKQKLQESLAYVLGDSASQLLLPNSIAIQKNGVLLRENDIKNLIVNTLTPQAAQLGGEVEFVDFRTPPYAFLSNKGQRVEIEPVNLSSGRISIKFIVKEMDDSIVRRFTGSVFLNLWKDIPITTRPFAKGDNLLPDGLSFARKNLAYIKGNPWDGRGGPWQFAKPMGAEQAILESDLTALAMIHKGQLINLVYQKGSIKITQQAEALQDGGPGDTINVRNVQSKKQVFGTVLDSQTVIIR